MNHIKSYYSEDKKMFLNKYLKWKNCWILLVLTMNSVLGSHYAGKTEFNYKNYLKLDENEESMGCRYRSLGPFEEPYFSLWADWGCYAYTRPDLFIGGFLNMTQCSTLPKFPAIMINGSCVVFHHNNTQLQVAVKESFNNDVIFNRWITCCEDALQCCRNVLSNSIPKDGHCPALWDGWSCISDEVAGTTSEMECSPYAYVSKPPQCTHYSRKECYINATWNQQTDYSSCAVTTRLISRTKWHMAMLSIALATCIPAMFILIFYKTLNVQKFFLIRNLLIAIIARCCFVLMSKSLVIMDELVGVETTVISNNDWPCKMLAFFEKLSANAVFTCMLLEGIFLHQLLTNVFQSRRSSGANMRYYYIGGAVITITCALTWSIVMAVHSDELCWVVTDSNKFHWINDTPRLAMLFLNIILLAHIVYTLWKTFKTRSNEAHPLLRTAKATLVCLPLFGIPLLLVIVRPNTESCGWEQFYYYVAYAFEGLQGVCIAILYCFTDREVHKCIRKSYRDLSNKLGWSILGRSSDDRRGSTWGTENERRTTFSTFSENQPKISMVREQRPDIIPVIDDIQECRINSVLPDERNRNLPQINVAFMETIPELEVVSYLNRNEPVYENIMDLKNNNTENVNPPANQPVSYFPNQNDDDILFDDFYIPNGAVDNDYVIYTKQTVNNQSTLPEFENNNNGIKKTTIDNEILDDVQLDVKALFRNRADGIILINDKS